LTSSGNLVLNPSGQNTFGLPQVIPNVKIEEIFLTDSNNGKSSGFQSQLSSYFTTITGDSYISKLLGQYSISGFPIANGTLDKIDTLASAAPDEVTGGHSYYTDAKLQSIIKGEISNGNTAATDGLNHLYFIFTPPGDAVDGGGGATSINSFLGYHSAFVDANNQNFDYYAVIPDQSSVNATEFGATLALPGETVVSSHEMAEAITDPVPVSGWVNPNLGGSGEVGDQAANEYYVQDSHEVQYEWSNAIIGAAHTLGSGANDLFINQVTPPAVPIAAGISVPVATFTSAHTSLTASNFSASVFNSDSTGHGGVGWTVTSITGSNGHFVVNASPNSAVNAGTYGKTFSTQEGLYVTVRDTPDATAVDGGPPMTRRYAPYVVANTSPLNYMADSTSGVNSFLLKENSGTGNFELYDNGNLVFTQAISKTTNINIAAEPAVSSDPGASEDSSLTIDFSGGVFTNNITFDGGPGSGTHTVTLQGGSVAGAIFNETTSSSGNIKIGSQTITYTHATAVTSTLTTQTDTINYGGSQTITLVDSGTASETKATSTAGATITFVNPSVSLSVADGGAGSDTVSVNGFGSGYNAALSLAFTGSSETVKVNTNLALGSGSSSGNLSITASAINLNAATINTTSGGAAGTVTLAGNVTLGTSVGITYAGTGGLSVTAGTLGLGSNQLTLTDSASGNTGTVSDAISGSGGSVVKGGPGTLTLSNTGNSYTGGTAVNGGTLKVAADGNLGNTSGTLTINAGTVEITAGYTTSRVLSVGNAASTIQVDASQSLVLNGAIGGGGALTKTGTGNLTLGTTNTYSGATNVNAGILFVNGSIGSTGTLTVGNGGTLSGGGSIGGPVSVSSGGTVDPGTATTAGKLTIVGGYTQASGGVLNIEVGGHTTAGTDYDTLAIGGAASLAGTINVSIINSYTPASGDSYQILSFASSSGDFTTKNGYALGNGLYIAEQFNSGNLKLAVSVGILVYQLQPPTSVQSGTAFNVQVKVTDSGGNTLTFDNADQVTVTLNKNTFHDGTTSNTQPVVNGVAAFSLTIDTGASGYFLTAGGHGFANVASNTFMVGQAPAITSANHTTFTVGNAGNFAVTTTGGPTPTLTESGALPSGVTFTDNGDGTASLAGTPAANTGGTYALVFTAHNGVGSDATQNFTLTVDQPAAITSGNTATFSVGNAGNFSVQTTGFPKPSLTESGGLPGGVSFTDNGNGTANLAGTPNANTGGSYSLTITAHNGVGSDATQSFTLIVDQSASITSANNATFTVGNAGNFSVQTTGFPKPSLTESGSLPGGVSFTDNGNGTASLAGTPNANTGGTYTLTITAHNGIGTDATQSFTLTVDQPAAITSGNTTTFTVGNAGSFNVQTTGFPKPALNESGSLPGGVTFTDNANGTATLAGTPNANTGGSYTLTITAHNGVGTDATQTFTLIVDQSAAITSGNSTTFTVGNAGSFNVQSAGFPRPSLTESGSLPGGVTFTDNGNGTASLAGTPNASTGGVYTFTITAHNGIGTDATQNFTLTVDQSAAIISANTTTFNVGVAGSFTVQSTGFPTSALNETGSLPSGVTFTDNGNGTASIAGTPGANTGASYTLTLTAHNGVGTDATQTFTLIVDQPAAITSGNSTTFTVGNAGSFNVQTTGFPRPSFTESGSLPGGVTFTDNGNGSASLAGTPNANTGGIYSFTITAHNGIGSDATQTFTLTVDQGSAITSANTTTFTVGTSGSFSVQATGFPTPGLSETGSLPSGVTFADNGNGTASLAGIPAANTGGSYSLTITAHNGVGADATQTFTLIVDQPPAITSGNTTTFTTGVSGSFTVHTTGFPAPSLTESGSLPGGVTFTDNSDGTASLAGTPNAGSGGVYAFTITAQNGVGTNATQAFTLVVDQPSSITSANTTTFIVGAPGGFTVLTAGFPVPNLSETGTLPTGVSFTDNADGTASLAGTPAAATGGTYSFTITAHNGIGTDATQTFTLVVDQASAITSGNTTTFLIANAGNFTVSATGFPAPALSDGGFSLPSGVTFTDHGDGTASLAGTPAANTGGSYTFTITAHNGVGSDATQSFTLIVDQPAAITSANSTTFQTGNAGSFSVLTTGFPAPALTETGGLPSGVAFTDNGDGTASLAGTPNTGTGGIYTFTITAHNGIGTDATQSFTLTVDQPSAITSAGDTTFTVGNSGSFNVATTGFPAPSLSETGSLPGGVTFTDNGNGTATLAGTPSANTGSVYSFTITAHNGIGSDATQTFALTVDQSTAITSGNQTTFTVGNAGSFAVDTTGFPVPALRETGSLPAGVSFTDNGDGTASLDGTPSSVTGGVYTFTITAHNGIGADATQNFTLTVHESASVTSANQTTFTVGTLGGFTVSTIGFPAPTLTESGSLPGGVTFSDNGDGSASLAGTPSAATGGTYAFTITAHNGIGADATQNFTLTVNQSAAIISGNQATFTVGNAGNFNVLTTGFPAPAITESGSLPAGVTLVDHGDGTASLAGTPATAAGGIYAFTITAHNGVGSDATQGYTLTVHEASAVISADSTTVTAGASGSFTVQTLGFPAPSLTESGSLPAGLTFADNGDGTASLAGTPGSSTGGIYTFTITAHNGIGADATQDFTLTVQQVSAITSGSSTTFTVGTPGSFSVVTTGFPAPALTESGSLPGGVTFVDNGNGTASLAGNPNAVSGGVYNFTITAHNGVGSDATQNFSLTVNEAASFSSANSTTFVAGSFGSFTVATIGFPAPAFSETGSLPSGVTLVDNGNGTASLSGTPGASTGGIYTFTLTAHNGIGADATQNFTLTVHQAAAITSANHTTFTVGSNGSFGVLTTGFPAPALSETGGLPTGVSFTDNGNGTASLDGTPAANTGGIYSFSIIAHNGVGSDATQNFTLTVNQDSAITSANHTTFIVGTGGSFTLNTTGFPAPALSDGGFSLPAGVTFTDNGNGTATLSGNAAAGTGGVYTFTVTAHNGIGADATQSFTLTVDEAPTITSAAATTFTTGIAGSFTVTTGHDFPAATTLVETGTLPTGITFVDLGNGAARLAGTAGANTGGTYSFTITAHNGVAPDATQDFTLEIDQPPAITSGNRTTFTVGTSGNFTVLTTGFPAPAVNESGSLPAGVSLVDNGDGTATLAGTPVGNVGGVYAFTITAHNGVGTNATQSFTLVVDQAPDITSANATTFLAGSGAGFTISTTGFPAPALSETGSLPTGIAFSDNGNGTASLGGIPGANTGGVYTFTVTAHNGIGADATQSFTLTVHQVATITSASNTTFTVGSAGGFTVNTAGFPVPSVVASGTLPGGVSFVDNGDGTASLAGTPSAGTGGVYAIAFIAHNGIGADATQNFTLTIDQAPAITSADHTTLIAGSAGSFTVLTTGFPAPALTEAGTLPSGLSFSDHGDGTASLAGTPGANTGGTYLFTITAHNGVGADATQTFTLTIDQAPTITSGAATTFTTGANGSFTVLTAGFPAPALEEIGSLPTGVGFTDNGDGTATLAGTPNVGTGGTYTVSFIAHNGIGSDATQSFTLTIDQPPALTSTDATTFTAGSSGSFTITTTGFPGPALSETGSLPAGVTLTDHGDGTATLGGIPSALTGGVYSIAITAQNGVGSPATQAFTLTIDEAPAVTTADHTTFTTGSAGSFTHLTTGYPAAALAESGALPAGVNFTDNGDGTANLAGTPSSGTGGIYALTITAHNGIGADATQGFRLMIDQAPAITSAAETTFTTGIAGSFAIATTGFPAPALSETGALPAGVTFTDHGDGTASLAGTPGPATGGTYTFTITAHNGVGSDATQAFTLTVDQPSAITSANHTTFTVGTSGNFGVQTTGFPAPALSETGALPAGVSFTDNGNGTASLTGTPAAGTGGIYSLTLTAHNGIGPDATQTYTLTIDQAPAVTSADHVTFTTGIAGSFTVLSTGFPAPALGEKGTLPGGVALTDNGDGTAALAGIPNAGTGGTYSITLTAHNGVGSVATQSFTLTIDQPSAITSADHATLTVGLAGTFTVTTTGFPAPALDDGTVVLPQGLAFTDNGNGTATLAGTPAAGTGGTYAITLTAHNAIGADATQTFTLTVGEAPTIVSADHTTFTVGTAGTFTVTAGHDYPPATTLTETGMLPAGITFVDNSNGTASLAGNAAVATGGIYAFTITAHNGIAPDATQSFTLTVDEAPSITSVPVTTFIAGQPGSFTLTTLGFPRPAWSDIGRLPLGVTFTDNGNGTATVSGIANPSTGVYPLTVTAAGNGVGPAVAQTFTLTIVGPPVFTTANSVLFTVGQTGAFNIATTPGLPASVTITEKGKLPAGVSFRAAKNGTAKLSGKPTAAAAGTYTITLTASSGVFSQPQTFTLSVQGAPKFTSTKPALVAVGQTSGLPIFKAVNLPIASYSFSGTLPAGMGFQDNGDGTAQLTGAAQETGTFSISINAANAFGTAHETFKLTVAQAASFTGATTSTFTVGQTGSFTIATTAADTGKTTLTPKGKLPAGVTFHDNGNGTATVKGKPAGNQAGVYTFNVTARHGSLLTVETVTLVVNPSPLAPTFTSPDTITFTIAEARTVQITTSSPAGNVTLTETGKLPRGISFKPGPNGTGTLMSTPLSRTGGMYHFTLNARNSAATTSEVFTVIVNQAPAIVSPAITSFAVGQAVAFAIKTSGFPAPTFSASGNLPPGIALVDNHDGTASIAGTPPLGSGGVYSFSVTATSAAGTTTRLFVVTVKQSPVFTNVNNTTFIAGIPGGFTITTAGTPTAKLTWKGTLPRGLKLVDNHNGTATLSGTASTRAKKGTYVLFITANNGVGPAAIERLTILLQ
jgi:autotransporter-associated beta strand protein